MPHGPNISQKYHQLEEKSYICYPVVRKYPNHTRLKPFKQTSEQCFPKVVRDAL